MRKPSGTIIAAVAAAAAAIALVIGGLIVVAQSNADLRDTLDDNQAAMAVLVDQYAALYAEAQAEGVDPTAPEPSELDEVLPTPFAGEPGPVGPGPSDNDVARAVESYCDSRGNCRGQVGPVGSTGPTGQPGPQGGAGERGSDGAAGPEGKTGANGADGAPGRPPTSAEIAAAVQAYCDSNNGCRGADGAPGPAGPTGPGPTDEQIAAAILAYCQMNPCGPQLPPPGEPHS